MMPNLPITDVVVFHAMEVAQRLGFDITYLEGREFCEILQHDIETMLENEWLEACWCIFNEYSRGPVTDDQAAILLAELLPLLSDRRRVQ